ncbi:MAG TPA: hypothetical protein ENF42_03070 [Candidatus Bathyarchaeota archaeon]|nr:hypothetical protein [Candidatus Bathyarchaeota archaeon]
MTRAEFKSLDELRGFFEDCIGCHNCMGVCPICFYDSPRYDYVTRCFLSRSPQGG